MVCLMRRKISHQQYLSALSDIENLNWEIGPSSAFYCNLITVKLGLTNLLMRPANLILFERRERGS